MAESNTQNVKLGVCRVTFGGTDLGFTKGGVEVSVETQTHEVTVDQMGDTPINEYITSRSCTVTVPLAETTLENLVKVMPGATLVTDTQETSKKYVTVPTATGQSLLKVAQVLILHPIANADNDKSDDFTVMRAATAGAMSYSYKLDDERIFSCEFKAYADEDGNLFKVGDTSAVVS
nr:MAG TPA: major tail protein [Caudoviricetes sp.]